MNSHRNVLSIVAGALLMTALPASAQLLGGSVDGAMNGAFGGTIGGAGIHGAGSAAGGFRVESGEDAWLGCWFLIAQKGARGGMFWTLDGVVWDV